jgi:hypothetical protein
MLRFIAVATLRPLELTMMISQTQRASIFDVYVGGITGFVPDSITTISCIGRQ